MATKSINHNGCSTCEMAVKITCVTQPATVKSITSTTIAPRTASCSAA
jgi:hypothetical protein